MSIRILKIESEIAGNRTAPYDRFMLRTGFLKQIATTAPNTEAWRSLVADATAFASHVSVRDFSGLYALGEKMRHSGCLYAATDAFGVVADFGPTPLRLDALLRQGLTLRALSRFDDADICYCDVEAGAEAVDNMRRIEAELGRGRGLLERGNVPSAIRVIDRAIEHARRVNEVGCLAKGLIDRAVIAGMRHDPLGVLRFSGEALRYVKTSSGRDRIWTNVAYASRELGRRGVALRAALRVAQPHVDHKPKSCAMLLLYHLAIDAREWGECERWRAAITALPSTPALRAEFLEATAREAASLGQWDEASAAVGEMIAVAESARLAEILFRGESAAEDLRRGRMPTLYEFRPAEEPSGAEADFRNIESILSASATITVGA